MHPMDRIYGRGLAARPMPLDSGIYPPGVKSPAERYEAAVRADERAKVAEEIAQAIERDDMAMYAWEAAQIARGHAVKPKEETQ